MKTELIQQFAQQKKGIESPHAIDAYVSNVIKKIGDEFVRQFPDEELDIRQYLLDQELDIKAKNEQARELYGY